MRTALLGEAARVAAAVEGGAVATMNAVTEESLDWNPAGHGAARGRTAETLRNSLSARHSDFKKLSAALCLPGIGLI
jgi:hypothetical protein